MGVKIRELKVSEVGLAKRGCIDYMGGFPYGHERYTGDAGLLRTKL